MVLNLHVEHSEVISLGYPRLEKEIYLYILL